MNNYFRYSKSVHDFSETIVDNHILCNQTSLVNDALKLDVSIAGITYDNILNLTGGEEEHKQVFQWWLVTDWLSKNLRLKGEVILEATPHSYWGRTTCGQSILLDGIIQRIVLEQLQIEEYIKFNK